MKRHKRILLSSLAAFAAALLGASFAACSKDEQIKYTFVLYGGETVTVTGKAGEKVEFPDTSKEGYIFKGWYLTEDYSGESFSVSDGKVSRSDGKGLLKTIGSYG